MIFKWIFNHAGLHTWYNRINQWCEHLECHDLQVLCWAYLQEVVFEHSPSDHETWSIWCHVGLHVEFYIHLAFTYSVGPSSVVWSELGPAPPFPPMRELEVEWSWALNLVREATLRWTCRSPSPPPRSPLQLCFTNKFGLINKYLSAKSNIFQRHVFMFVFRSTPTCPFKMSS